MSRQKCLSMSALCRLPVQPALALSHNWPFYECTGTSINDNWAFPGGSILTASLQIWAKACLHGEKMTGRAVCFTSFVCLCYNIGDKSRAGSYSDVQTIKTESVGPFAIR